MPDKKTAQLINCKKCNRLFSAVDDSLLCSRCNDAIDDGFTRVREYIYDHPTSSLKQVSEGTEIKPDVVLKWIREGKIILGGSSTITFCERCKAPTDGTRYCVNCIQEIARGLKEGIGTTLEKDKAGMHIKPDRK